jgi:hypothetical protein
VRLRTTLTAAQEAVAQAKAVGAVGVAVTVALHQADRRANPPAMSVDAAARWGIGRVSAARSPRSSRHTSHKMGRSHSCLERQP